MCHVVLSVSHVVLIPTTARGGRHGDIVKSTDENAGPQRGLLGLTCNWLSASQRTEITPRYSGLEGRVVNGDDACLGGLVCRFAYTSSVWGGLSLGASPCSRCQGPRLELQAKEAKHGYFLLTLTLLSPTSKTTRGNPLSDWKAWSRGSPGLLPRGTTAVLRADAVCYPRLGMAPWCDALPAPHWSPPVQSPPPPKPPLTLTNAICETTGPQPGPGLKRSKELALGLPTILVSWDPPNFSLDCIWGNRPPCPIPGKPGRLVTPCQVAVV